VDDDDDEKGGGAAKDDELEEFDQKDDGYIKLVLRVLARMCDGQHSGLQVMIFIIFHHSISPNIIY